MGCKREALNAFCNGTCISISIVVQ
jgi:hypothetical protein